MLSKRSAPSLWLILVGAFAALLVIVSIVLNLVLDNSDDLLPEDTPEGAVQRYLRAIVDDDVSEAYAYVSASLQGTCTLQHFIQTTEYQRSRDLAARVTSTIDVDGKKLVSVEITEPDSGGLFGGGRYSYTVSFTLSLEDGAWQMSEPPWPMSGCPPERDTPVPVPTVRAAMVGPIANGVSRGQI